MFAFLAAWSTSSNRSMLSLMVQLMFFFENDSLAAAKTAISVALAATALSNPFVKTPVNMRF
jgi:hypothetical protein